ncbi:MAG: M1 family metallopeptidase, partial [Terriglobales bacterium]
MARFRTLLCLLALPGLLLADTFPRPAGFTATHYDFEVTLSDGSNQIQVRDTVTVRATQNGLREVALDLCQLRSVDVPADRSNPCLLRTPYGVRGGAAAAVSNAGRGMAVTAVTGAGGTALQYQQAHDRLLVQLAQPLAAGAEASFTVAYHGVPANGLLIGNNKYGDREFFTNEWPDMARNWLAVVDHPSDKASKRMSITAPRKYQVISNGVKTEQTDLPADLRRTVWREDTPICTWQFSLGAAPFAVDYFGQFHGIPLSAWVYPQEREAGFAGFSAYTEPILEFYSDHIGPYSYEKLAQVEANGTGGGMELASDIFYGYAPSGPGLQLIAHERAHQWFGDSATESDWDDVWLSEGFATYFALLYQEHQDGRDAFLQGVEASAAQARRYAQANPDSTIVHRNLSDISQVIANNAQIYQGGAQVLHMLRGVLGDGTFWAGIRRYYRRFRNANASSLDFQHAMEDACKAAPACPSYGRDLGWYFSEWLNRGGIMNVSGSWSYDADAKQLEITLQQAPNQGKYYQMPIELG